MICRELLGLSLFVLLFCGCQSQKKDPLAELSKEVSVALSNINEQQPVLENPESPPEPVRLNEEKVINAIYPKYFLEVYNSDESELAGVDYVRDEFSESDLHTIEEISGYRLPSKKILTLVHWSPINGTGSQVTEVYVLSKSGKSFEVISGTDETNRIVYGGGTRLSELPKPVKGYLIAEDQIVFAVSQVSRHAPSDSYTETVTVFEVQGKIINPIFEFDAFSGHSSFRLREELNSSHEELIRVGMMIPNHIYRHDIEQIESILQITNSLTNGHFDLILKEEIFRLTDDLKEIRYDFQETLYKYDGSAYMEGGQVSS